MTTAQGAAELPESGRTRYRLVNAQAAPRWPSGSGGRPRPRARSLHASPRCAVPQARSPCSTPLPRSSSCPSRSASATHCKVEVLDRDGPLLEPSCSEFAPPQVCQSRGPPQCPPSAPEEAPGERQEAPSVCLPRRRLRLGLCLCAASVSTNRSSRLPVRRPPCREGPPSAALPAPTCAPSPCVPSSAWEPGPPPPLRWSTTQGVTMLSSKRGRLPWHRRPSTDRPRVHGSGRPCVLSEQRITAESSRFPCWPPPSSWPSCSLSTAMRRDASTHAESPSS